MVNKPVNFISCALSFNSQNIFFLCGAATIFFLILKMRKWIFIKVKKLGKGHSLSCKYQNGVLFCF